MNDILNSTLILSALHPFFKLPNDVLKRKRGTFSSVSSDLMAQKGTVFAVGSDVLKSAKMVLLKSLKQKNSVFKLLGSH